MDFASKYILNFDEDEYECVSDDEFDEGMDLSGSSESEEDDGGPEQSNVIPRPKNKSNKRHHWRQNQKLPLQRIGADVNSTAAKRWFRRADTNVVSVSFDTLLSPGDMHAGDPVICDSCHAILSHLSKPSQQDENMMWKCEFCGNSTVVDVVPEEIPTTEEVTFLMEPGKATASCSMSGRDESLVVFCVDTSGSMCVTSEVNGKVKLRGNSHLQRLDSFNTEGDNQFLPSQVNRNVTYISRLQAMQAAVDHQLGEMAKNFPHRRVALVTFSSDVTVVGDGFTEEVTVAGEKLKSVDQLTQIGSDVACPQPIHKCRKKLGDKLYKFEEGGATALGPALVVATNIAASHPGSKVIVCTDGKANIGLGKLEDDADAEAGAEFYTSVGDEAVTKGVTISVITIQGTDCKLVHLGQLADKTGGQVNIVDPLNLTTEFGNILADQIIATNVKSKFIVHKALYIIHESDPDCKKCMAEYCPGNVQTSTSITFEFARRSNKMKGKATQKRVDSDETVPMVYVNVGASEPTYDNLTGASDPTYDNLTGKESPGKDKRREKGGDGACALAAEVQPQINVTSDDGPEVPAETEFPFQLQIEYTDTEGTKALRVVTRSVPATKDREMAESNANLDVLGTHAAKKAADLALQGEYSLSRGKALMHQRLAWRSCQSENASTDQRTKYKNIYSKIKIMENKLQRKQTEEIISRGHTYSDDEDDEMEGSSGLIPLMAACRTSSLGRKKTRHSERSVDMDDSFANMAYNFRRVSKAEMSSDGSAPALPRMFPMLSSRTASAPQSTTNSLPFLPPKQKKSSDDTTSTSSPHGRPLPPPPPDSDDSQSD